MGRKSEIIGADLVGSITIRRDAIATHYAKVDLPLFHVKAGSAINNELVLDTELLKFPGSQAGTLQAWPGLIHQHRNIVTMFMSGANNAQRRAIADGGETAGIAMMNRRGLLRYQFQGIAAKLLAYFNIFPGNLVRLVKDKVFELTG